ncbi:MAG: metallophosphoesterase [Myxococcales bacterium]|nr:metallophosphoesterase [Myxococcales bacterium]
MAGPFRHHVAIGDPQAPFATVRAVLAAHHLLDGERLRGDVLLISIGDHFDWGPPEARREATDDALAMLSWLASHPPDQVVLLAGNHDLARVGELSHFADDSAFDAARQQADLAYRRGNVDRERQAELLERYPFLPTAELLSRDCSCFSVAQRVLVTELLRTRRFRLAHEHQGLLVVHAGVTLDDLALLHGDTSTAAGAAHALNAFLDDRVARWKDGPLDLTPLHQAGDAKRGEGRGVLFHRPVDPKLAKPGQLDGPPRRRFDPRRLPPNFPQAVGHVRDKKCREELAAWCEPGSVDGPIRSLRVEADMVRYQLGCQVDARMYFIDGGMLHARAEDYELFDLDRRQPMSKLVISGT